MDIPTDSTVSPTFSKWTFGVSVEWAHQPLTHLEWAIKNHLVRPNKMVKNQALAGSLAVLPRAEIDRPLHRTPRQIPIHTLMRIYGYSRATKRARPPLMYVSVWRYVSFPLREGDMPTRSWKCVSMRCPCNALVGPQPTQRQA